MTPEAASVTPSVRRMGPRPVCVLKGGLLTEVVIGPPEPARRRLLWMFVHPGDTADAPENASSGPRQTFSMPSTLMGWSLPDPRPGTARRTRDTRRRYGTVSVEPRGLVFRTCFPVSRSPRFGTRSWSSPDASASLSRRPVTAGRALASYSFLQIIRTSDWITKLTTRGTGVVSTP